MRGLVAILLVGLAASPVAAADEVIEIDANTRIKVDPKLKTVTGTDPAAAGGGARERALEELKAGSDATPAEKIEPLPKPPAEDRIRKPLPR